LRERRILSSPKERVKKMRTVWLIFLTGLIILTSSCATPTGTKTQAPAVKVWWGNAEEIKQFLDGPQAQAERWFIQAID
jgi:hypothetical protein